ncbi:MAG: methyltransferase domain-containing protein [Rhodospirillaceae bacterium]
MTEISLGIGRTAAIAAAFGAAAETYEGDAGLQRRVAGKLAGRVAALPLPPSPRVLEIGCGTGFFSRALAVPLPRARWLATDLSEAMVARCRHNGQGGESAAFLVMDGERPCLAPQPGEGFDLICASLALQWFARPAAALAAWADILAPGGYIAWTTLADGTFREWRAAHQALGLSAGVADYPDAAGLEALWPSGGRGTVEVEELSVRYPDPRSFLDMLKHIGARVPAAGHRPLSAGALRRVLRGFAPGDFGVTWQIAYGLFRKDGAP